MHGCICPRPRWTGLTAVPEHPLIGRGAARDGLERSCHPRRHRPRSRDSSDEVGVPSSIAPNALRQPIEQLRKRRVLLNLDA